MINKESKQPAGLGRLIQSAKRPKNIQEGLFLDGQRIGLVRFLGSDGDFSKVTFEGKTVSRRQEYNSETGNLKSDYPYLGGEQEGQCIEYFENGKIQQEAVYLAGKR